MEIFYKSVSFRYLQQYLWKSFLLNNIILNILFHTSPYIYSPAAANCSSQKDNCATHKEWYHKLHLIARDFLLQKRMCFAHSRAERGRLRQIASSRECISPAHSAFIVTGNSIRISCYNKNNPRTTGEECEG